MKIEKLHLNNERNDSHFQFMTEFRDLVVRFGVEALKIAAQFAAFLGLYEREDEALKKVLKSALTPKIHEADAARDDTLAGLIDVVKGMCRHYAAAVRDAALRVQVVLDAYKHIASKSINEETSAVYNLVQELKSAKYAADIELIGVAGWVNELENRNNKVEALVKGRYDESAAKSDVVLKDARRLVDAQYKDICDIINAYVILEGPAAYETFIRTLNEVIKKYAMKHRKHRGKKAGAEETESAADEGAEGDEAV